MWTCPGLGPSAHPACAQTEASICLSLQGTLVPSSVLSPQAYSPACSDSSTAGPQGCLGMGCRARPLEVMEVIVATYLSTGHTCPRSWPCLTGALPCSHQTFPGVVAWAGSCSGSVHVSKWGDSVTSVTRFLELTKVLAFCHKQ